MDWQGTTWRYAGLWAFGCCANRREPVDRPGQGSQVDTIAPLLSSLWSGHIGPSRKDEVKLTAAVDKLIEEDQSLSLQQDQAWRNGSVGAGRDASESGC